MRVHAKSRLRMVRDLLSIVPTASIEAESNAAPYMLRVSRTQRRASEVSNLPVVLTVILQKDSFNSFRCEGGGLDNRPRIIFVASAPTSF